MSEAKKSIYHGIRKRGFATVLDRNQLAYIDNIPSRKAAAQTRLSLLKQSQKIKYNLENMDSNKAKYVPNSHCSICNDIGHWYLKPMICSRKHFPKFHTICHYCWFNVFANENASHSCPGCAKNLPLVEELKLARTTQPVVEIEDSDDDITGQGTYIIKSKSKLPASSTRPISYKYYDIDSNSYVTEEEYLNWLRERESRQYARSAAIFASRSLYNKSNILSRIPQDVSRYLTEYI